LVPYVLFRSRLRQNNSAEKITILGPTVGILRTMSRNPAMTETTPTAEDGSR